MVPARREADVQLAILLLALVLAAIGGAERFAGFVLAYGIAWGIANLAALRGWAPPRLSRGAKMAIAALVAATPITVIGARWDALITREGLLGLDVHLRDRLRLEAVPAIHPALVAADRPQTFLVYAPGGQRARVALAPGIAVLDAEPLGHGVFRVDYDPRQHGAPAASGPARARIEVDGVATERAVTTLVPLAHPRWLRASPDRRQACTTSEETDELVRIDARGLAGRMAVGDGPSDCTFLAGGAVAVAHRYAPTVAIVDPGGAIVDQIEVGWGGHRLAASPDLTRLAVALEGGEVVIADVRAGVVQARIEIGGLPDALAFAEDAATLIVARRQPAALLRITVDGAHAAIVAERALLAPVAALARREGGGSVIVAVTDWSDDPVPHLGNHYVQDQLVEIDTRSLAPLRHVLTARRSPRQDAAGGLDRGVSPLSIDVAPDGALWVAFAGSDEVARLVVGGPEGRAIDVAALGLAAPHGALLLADGAIAVSSPSGGRVAILEPSGRLRASADLAPGDATLLREDPEALRRRFGERAFYEATRAGVACQSCHLHGESDGLVHNIGGRVLVPTLDVRGIAGTSPYLRDGSYPRIGDLHEVADTLYRGYREPAGDRASTLEAWIASLPLPPPRPERDPEAERRGLDVFVAAGCPSCHAFPALTNLGRHPVHAVFPRAAAEPGLSLDTPSLRGLTRQSRYLFDGRARSLEDVFRVHNPDDRHGRTAALSDREIADLIRFLESL